MGYIDREMLAVDKAMHHEDITGLEIVLLFLVHDKVDRTSLECERNRLAVKEGEHLRLIKQSHVHTTTVRTVVMDDLIVCLRNLRFHDEILEHETVLDLGNSEKSVPCTVLFLHAPDDLGHVLKLLLILHLSPLVLSIRKELLVVLCRIVVYIKQILKVIESDHIVLRTLFLCISSSAEKHQGCKNH